jgi:ribonucleoside-diphosphate reductase alpha chain
LSISPFETQFAHSVVDAKYMQPHGETHWNQTADRVTHHPMEALRQRTGLAFVEEQENVNGLIRARAFLPGGRYLYGCGNDFHQVQNCLLLSVEDSREGWADLAWKSFMSLMTGAGVGIYYGKLREKGARIKRTGGVATGPVPLAVSINEQGRATVGGGNRRSAIWGGLSWSHPDILEWIVAKDWPEWLREQKEKDPATPAPLDMTNISVCLDDEFFEAYRTETHPMHAWAHKVYWTTIEHMVTRGEPGFSVDLGEHRDEKLRNACTEIVSADDSDICNLGGVVLPRFDTVQDFENAVRMGTLYLTAGTVYSDVPYDKVSEVREQNRRLGLDLIGVSEFLMKHGVRYGTDEAEELLEPYMQVYDRALEFAVDWQDRCGLSRSIAATSGAPTGTRGIAAESTTGWEPPSAVAYKRVVRSSHGGGETRQMQYVVDPTVARLVREGYIDPNTPVEDAHSLAYDYERRFRMQAYAQSHTDQAISMTVNLPYQMYDVGEQRDFGDCLMQYLPKLRGITCYPDGAIPGQPIVPVPLSEALGKEGVIFEESEEKCASGFCGV